MLYRTRIFYHASNGDLLGWEDVCWPEERVRTFELARSPKRV